MVNLLPQNTIKKLRYGYYQRLVTTILFLINTTLIIGMVLLMPSYIVSERSADSAERYLMALEETVGVRARAGVEEETKEITERITLLNELNNEPSSLSFFESAMGGVRPGVRITEISFTRNDSFLAVSMGGIAETRGALIAFADQLRAEGEFENVDIPVSQLALGSNIPFLITARYRSDSL